MNKATLAKAVMIAIAVVTPTRKIYITRLAGSLHATLPAP